MTIKILGLRLGFGLGLGRGGLGLEWPSIGLVSISDDEVSVSVSDDEVSVSVSDDEAKTPSLEVSLDIDRAITSCTNI